MNTSDLYLTISQDMNGDNCFEHRPSQCLTQGSRRNTTASRGGHAPRALLPLAMHHTSKLVLGPTGQKQAEIRKDHEQLPKHVVQNFTSAPVIFNQNICPRQINSMNDICLPAVNGPWRCRQSRSSFSSRRRISQLL